MTVLAEATAAQHFGRNEKGEIVWPGTEAPIAAPAAPVAAPAPAPAPRAAAPAKAVAPAKLEAEPPPEPPVVGQSSPLDRTVKKKTLLGG